MDGALHGSHEAPLAIIRQCHFELASELKVDGQALLGTLLKDLERLAYGISLTRDAGPSLRARVLALGEIMVTTLGAAFLQHQGIPAQWLDARKLLTARYDARLLPRERYLSAQCHHDPDKNLQAVQHEAVLTQGFIASDQSGETVLVVWGGSDTSAAYFASKLQANRLEIWTDVPGMFTANPSLIPSARLLKHLEYDEAQELASSGAEVLHPRCIEPLRQQRIPLHVRSTHNPQIAGTVIAADAVSYGAQVKAISARTDLTLITMETPRMWHSVGFLARVFSVFERHAVSVGLVATSETNVTVSIDPIHGFTLDATAIEALLTDLSAFCKARQISGCAAVSLVGRAIRSVLHELGPALEVLDEQKLYLVTQAASDLNFTFVVDIAHAARLTRKLHGLIFGQIGPDGLFGSTYRELFGHSPGDVKAPWWRTHRSALLEMAADSAPCFVYDAETISNTAQRVQALNAADRCFYSMKACSHPEVLRLLYAAGLGFECVSPGELRYIHTLFKDLDKDRVLFTPNFVPRQEYELGFELAGHVTLDSVRALELWPDVFAGREVLARVDPGHGHGHHKHVRTAGAQSKFGITPDVLPHLAHVARQTDLHITGLHAHVGSGILTPATWSETAYFLASLRTQFPEVRRLNVGGGFGVPEKPGTQPLDLDQLSHSLQEFHEACPRFELWVEPGRFLVAESGVLLARVTQIKHKGSACYVGVEAGMNSLIRPALYGSYHRVVNLSRLDAPAAITAEIVGPICETGDILGRARRLPHTEEGDVLLIANAGAYGRVMSSDYNMRAPAAEIMLHSD